MKIMIINPNSDSGCTDIVRKKAEAYVSDRVTVECLGLKNSPLLIASYEDCAKAEPEMAELVRANQDEFDAFIIACFSDPNLDIMREISRKPVFGIAESAMRMAPLYGEKYTIISPTMQAGKRKYALVRKYFCQEQLHSVVVPNSGSRDGLLEAGRQSIKDGADVILLGCANYACDDRFLERELHSPVLEGVSCALALAEGTVNRIRNGLKSEVI